MNTRALFVAVAIVLAVGHVVTSNATKEDKVETGGLLKGPHTMKTREAGHAHQQEGPAFELTQALLAVNLTTSAIAELMEKRVTDRPAREMLVESLGALNSLVPHAWPYALMAFDALCSQFNTPLKTYQDLIDAALEVGEETALAMLGSARLSESIIERMLTTLENVEEHYAEAFNSFPDFAVMYAGDVERLKKSFADLAKKLITVKIVEHILAERTCTRED